MSNGNVDELVAKISEVVRECSKIILEADRTYEMTTQKEGHANFVTTYDVKVQQSLKSRLLDVLPEAAFAGEEDDGGVFCIPDKGYVFVVDPIDGTTNFIWDYKTSCISVGLLLDGKQYLGVVYNPYLDEMYTAVAGHGAYLNGRKIRAYNGGLENTLTIFGTAPYYEELKKKSFELAYNLIGRAADVRRSGSAAIDMCNVAAGRASLYFELRLSPWDFAAASLIVREAGGIVTTMENTELIINEKCSCLARGQGLEDDIRNLFFK